MNTIVGRKTRSTIYTPEKVTNARRNAEKYDWAKKAKDDAVKQAETYATLSLDQLWHMVPGNNVPRSYNTNQFEGNLSPVNGTRIMDEHGRYPWKADQINHPWKVIDPVSGDLFPSNDFGAYYESGLDQHGVFQPALADRRLLVNTLYPDKGEDWGVDDGFGWNDPETGKLYTFIAYYTHWHLWYGADGIILRALSSLKHAYILTGDMKYARPAAVLLDRIADLYPSMDIAVHDPNLFLGSHGGSPAGKTVGSIWETGTAKTLVDACDALFPVFDDEVITAFLGQKSTQYALRKKESGDQIRSNIEDGIIRQIYPGIKKSQIRGNNGMHQSALAMAAVVMDSLPETKEWIDFNFQPGKFIRGETYRVTGGNILSSMINDVDRDGHGNEAAPGYNLLWLNSYIQAANVLRGYDKYPAADLYENVKFRKMFSAMYPLMMIGKYFPQIGDSGSTGNPGLFLDRDQMVHAFDVFRDPVFAQLAYFLNGNRTDGIHGGIYSEDPEQIARDIESVIAEQGPYVPASNLLAGYGFAALRDGTFDTRDTQRGLWLYFGRNGGHGHRDTLNLGLHAFGLDLAPDLGYPEAANATDVHRHEWMLNTIAHNTVMVDKTKQHLSSGSEPKHFDDCNMVKLIDVEAPKPYPQTTMYRRTTALIKVDDQHSYAVDFFRVKGGNDHHFSFHGAEGTVTTEGLQLTKQTDGTYAGEQIEFGVRPEEDSVTGSGYTGSGFHWLKNVERDAAPQAKFSADWKITDTWNALPQEEDIHLRLTMLGNYSDAALADGVPSRNVPGNPNHVRYLLVHNEGEQIESIFTSVLEPYKTTRFINAIEEVPVLDKHTGLPVPPIEARAIKVTLADGRTDYIFNALDNEKDYIADNIKFRGFFAVYAEKSGNPVFTYLNDAGYIENHIGIRTETAPRICGTVKDFTRDLSLKNDMIVQFDAQSSCDTPEDLLGRFIYVKNDGKQNAAYPIESAEQIGEGLYRLGTGDITFIRACADAQDLKKGYLYNIAEKDSFVIPLSKEELF